MSDVDGTLGDALIPAINKLHDVFASVGRALGRERKKKEYKVRANAIGLLAFRRAAMVCMPLVKRRARLLSLFFFLLRFESCNGLCVVSALLSTGNDAARPK